MQIYETLQACDVRMKMACDVHPEISTEVAVCENVTLRWDLGISVPGFAPAAGIRSAGGPFDAVLLNVSAKYSVAK